MNEMVILVDENDRQIGVEDKINAHQGEGKLHRALSIFIFNPKGKLLIQRRAKTKYHCGGLWTNTCCSHPRPEESLEQAAHRRLKEEMGFDCDFKEVFSFIYKANFDNGLTEWEFDHVLIGEFDGEIKANPKEVADWKWVGLNELKEDIKENPNEYTQWFKIAIDRTLSYYTQYKE